MTQVQLADKIGAKKVLSLELKMAKQIFNFLLYTGWLNLD